MSGDLQSLTRTRTVSFINKTKQRSGVEPRSGTFLILSQQIAQSWNISQLKPVSRQNIADPLSIPGVKFQHVLVMIKGFLMFPDFPQTFSQPRTSP